MIKDLTRLQTSPDILCGAATANQSINQLLTIELITNYFDN